MTSISPSTAKNHWQLRDIVVMAVLATACGAIYLAWDLLYKFVPSSISPVASAGFNGLWWIAGAIVPYIIRRPGAALLAESIGGFVEFALGSPYGIQAFTIGIAQGLTIELAFAAGGYRRWGLPWMLFATAMGAVGNFVYSYFYYGVNEYTVPVQIGYFVVSMLSGAILAGLLSKWVGDALKRTGVLRNFEISRASQGSA
jgi:energy-coupling factor transport system substrate-specific component